MARVSIRDLSKVYDDGTVALDRVNIDIQAGEFVVLVGPSGCGKSTLLRSVAGLERPSSGTIEVDGERIDALPPSERGVGMVFQDYALYPHMTVRENLAFGLKLKRMSRDEIQGRIQETARMLELERLLNRSPSQLSGGQRQRVAIGRALVKRPAVFLLDEPLSNLDAQLRAQTRLEIAALHKKIKSTTIYVTHDQEEAMTLANRIAVLKAGKIQQLAAPMELYHFPANRFVASFVGSPSMNFLEGDFRIADGRGFFETEAQSLGVSAGYYPPRPGKYLLGFRPEAFRFSERGLRARVDWVEYHGYEVHWIVTIGKRRVTLRMVESVPSREQCAIDIDFTRAHWFEATGRQQRVMRPPTREVA